jgi:hypothetical protein
VDPNRVAHIRRGKRARLRLALSAPARLKIVVQR